MNRRTLYQWLLPFLVLLLALAACSESEEQPTDTPSVDEAPLATDDQAPVEQPTSVASTAYPGANPTSLPVVDSGYPAPVNTPESFDPAQPLIVPDPDADTGVVTGKLLTPDQDGVPFLATLYLGTTVNAVQEDSPPMISLSESDSPQGVQDEATGLFVFDNVPPGAYALISWTPIASHIISDPDTGEDIYFDVVAGETTDLGVIGIP